MRVIGNVGGNVNGEYTYYYWYINGAIIQYITGITGYIGSNELRYGESLDIPLHDAKLHYVLNNIKVNSIFESALVGSEPKYTLLDGIPYDSNGVPVLNDNEIALEVRMGDVSLGFIWYDVADDTWYLVQDTDRFEGFKDAVDGGKINENIISSLVSVDSSNSTLELVLYKSTNVNEELLGMTMDMTFNIYYPGANENEAGDQYNAGASTLIFHLTLSIERLVPEQYLYYQPGVSYGVDSSSNVYITGHSSFTAHYITKYIPSAFPHVAGDGIGMTWALSAQSYYYYVDKKGNYLTVNGDGEVAYLSNSLLTFVGSEIGSLDETDKKIYRYNGKYAYRALNLNDQFEIYYFDEVAKCESGSRLPRGTKITMVLSPSTTPTYYYYICTADDDYIDLKEFKSMGTDTAIGDMAEKPAFMQWYDDQLTARVSEEILFIFDFSNATWGAVDEYSCNLEFKHIYGNSTSSADIMDFVAVLKDEENVITGYKREYPRLTKYDVDVKSNGLDNFEVEVSDVNYDYDTIDLAVNIDLPDSGAVNTNLFDSKYVLRITLPDGKLFPAGIKAIYNGKVYYPSYGNKFILIEVPRDGEYKISIESYIDSMMRAFGVEENEDIKFNFDLFSDTYDTNSNALSVRGEAVDNTAHVDIYTVKTNPDYFVKVDCEADARILKAGEKLTFSFACGIADGSEIEMEKPSLAVEVKTPNGFVEPEESIFVDATELSVGTNRCSFTVAEDTAQGSYRLKFSYGTCVEYLNIIVTK